MTGAARVWLEVAHHAAFRAGGWAYVRADGAAVTGAAGGDRRAEAERIALEGLIAALTAGAGGGPVRLMTTSPLIAALPARLRAATAGQDAPSENLALWAQAATALAGVDVVRVAAAPGTPTAFAASWAEFARDKAKAGRFTWPIPRPNLAKAGVGD
ncbi:MAG: ribonuclease H [Phenylobacterium sp.]|nr:MAG: ribonuclease H [Phenylobacterium sp.]